MGPARRFIGAASNLVQFFPLSLFATYAFWRGAPTGERWVQAFELAALAAVVQLLILLPQRRPMNRLILGANLYLLIGGAAALAKQWWLLEAYGALRESGIFLSMLGTIAHIDEILRPLGDRADAITDFQATAGLRRTTGDEAFDFGVAIFASQHCADADQG